jgi:hypothetical protein
MLSVGETLADEQWHQSGCAPGWSVKDVVAHAGCPYRGPQSRLIAGHWNPSG